MKLYIINKFLYPKGGDAISTLITGNLLSSNGHEVIFWGMKNERDPPYPHRDTFIDEIDLNSTKNIKQQFKAATNILYSLEAKSKIEKLIQRTGKPDIIHLNNFSHQISPSILHIFRKYHIPCVMTLHDYKLVCASYTLLDHGQICEACKGGQYYHCFLRNCVKGSRAKSLLNTIEMYAHHKILKIYDLIDIFISPSLFLKNKVEEMGFKGKIIYLPNFVNLDDYSFQYESTERSIVYFGRLSKEKGLFTLLDAVKGINIKLKIIGDGPLKNDLEFKIKKDKLENVVLMGYKTGHDLKNEIKKSMLVVLPSECYENNPLSIIEGFALGKPAIGARIGGIPELIRDGETGLTFEPGNVQDLTNRIQLLIEQPEIIIEMGKKARNFVEFELNSNKHYQALIKIYEQAINNHK